MIKKRILFLFIILIVIFSGYYLLKIKNIYIFSKIEGIFFKTTQMTSSQNANQVGNDQEIDLDTRLKDLQKKDERISIILKQKNLYPEELLDMLSRNIDMLDFVLDFPEKKGQVFSDNIGEVKKGTYPLLLQWDPRWGYGEYGDNYIAINGCAPTALAIVIAGLTGNNSITPYMVSQYAEKHGYYKDGVGTSWSLMTDGSKYFKIEGNVLSLTKSSVYDSLTSGHPIICSMRPGDFTTQGHFIVLTGIENEKIKINDPNSIERSNQLWDYDDLEYQIKNLWSFQPI